MRVHGFLWQIASSVTLSPTPYAYFTLPAPLANPYVNKPRLINSPNHPGRTSLRRENQEIAMAPTTVPSMNPNTQRLHASTWCRRWTPWGLWRWLPPSIKMTRHRIADHRTPSSRQVGLLPIPNFQKHSPPNKFKPHKLGNRFTRQTGVPATWVRSRRMDTVAPHTYAQPR